MSSVAHSGKRLLGFCSYHLLVHDEEYWRYDLHSETLQYLLVPALNDKLYVVVVKLGWLCIFPIKNDWKYSSFIRIEL